MFTITRETGGRRRTKVYASNTAAKSSKTSLLSVFTVGSAGSGDSNSTITQSSYNRSQHRRRRRRHRRHTMSGSIADDKNGSVDVFDFLVEKDASQESLSLMDHTTDELVDDYVDDDPEHEFEDLDEQEECNKCQEKEGLNECEECAGLEIEPEQAEFLIGSCNESNQSEQRHMSDQAADGDIDSDGEVLTPDIVINTEDTDPERYYRSMSDSGISMGNCSMDTSLASLPSRHSVGPNAPLSRPSSRSRTGNELAVIDPRWAWSTSPGPFHDGHIPPPAPVPPPIIYEMPPYPPYPPYTPYGTPPPMPEEETRGPVIRIREPSHQDVKPGCFRSFAKVSTRVLLQLQDDIAELEGELSVLDAEVDAIEAESGSDEDVPAHPNSAKRMLKAREMEIYDELQFKLGQYSSALESMHKMESISQPATKADLTKHHRWLEARISPSYKARHLVSNDLRTFSKIDTPEKAAAPEYDTQFLAYTAVVNTLLPLMLFKLVNSVLTRLILLVVVVISGATVHDRTKTKVRAEDINCILLCVGISASAAFFL